MDRTVGNVLVTGCAGFVGTHLCLALLRRGLRVLGVDNFFCSDGAGLAELERAGSFAFQESDIREPDLLERLSREHGAISHVFHLAAISDVNYSMTHGEEVYEVVVEATRSLHEQARRLGCLAFVHAGSAAEYGEAAPPLEEHDADDATRQLSPYGRAKFLASRLIESSGWGSSLRCFNIYGPLQNPASPYSGVISLFGLRALRGEALAINGDGGQSRDFIYIDDCIRAYLLAAGLDGEGVMTGIFNVATGRPTTIGELAGRINAITGSEAGCVFRPCRPGDIRHSYASCGAFHAATGFVAKTGLDAGLARTLAWLRERI
ncbi:MAG: NAD-dependent epimerase/dehydratase family protein [Desulfovibrionaceae bacterium]